MNQQLSKDGIPTLLLLNIQSHELAICNDCHQFLDAFMHGDWITKAKQAINNGEHMQIKMLTSADKRQPASSKRLVPAFEENETIPISDMPDILNMDGINPEYYSLK